MGTRQTERDKALDGVFEVIHLVDVVLCSGREHDAVDICGLNCSGDTFGSNIEWIDLVGIRVPILDGNPGRTSVCEQVDCFENAGFVIGKTPLGIDIEGDVNRSRQRTNMVNQLVPGHLAVVTAERFGVARAGCCHSCKPQPLELHCRAYVPRVWHHEQVG
jgi:hypothetical protein